MGTTDLTCAPRTSCVTSALTRVALTAMSFAFVAWLLSTGVTEHNAVLVLAGVLTLIAATTTGLSPRWRAALARALDLAPASLTVSPA
ncbi:hypothetical protein [Lentzea sp. CA-135723]|uniref:hypothetical protein n=1 Tax=Lentzea sp. CA-135723 TaxID=3239950 RepID=UPI003D8A212A